MGYSSSPDLVNLEVVNLTRSGNVAPMAGDNAYLTPDYPFIYIVKNLTFNVNAIPAAVGAGVHDLLIRNVGDVHKIAQLLQWDNQDIKIDALEFSATTEIPSEDMAQANICAGGWLMASNDAPLQFRYFNESIGNTQTNSRFLYVTYQKVKRTLI